MSELTIRPARPDEAPILADLIAIAFAQYRGKLVPESGAFNERPETIARELAEPGHAALLALDGERAVGCVMVKPEDGDLYFGRLSVAPEGRRRGVAAALVRAVEDWAAHHGYPAVVLGVRIALPDNQRLFAAHGYVEVCRTAHPGFDHPTSITMRKVL